jgi:hypothetical protein
MRRVNKLDMRQVNKVQVRRSKVRVIGVEAGSGIDTVPNLLLLYLLYMFPRLQVRRSKVRVVGVEAGSGIVKLREGLCGAFYYQQST